METSGLSSTAVVTPAAPVPDSEQPETELERQFAISKGRIICASLTKELACFVLLRHGARRGWNIRSRGFLRRHFGQHEFARKIVALYDEAAPRWGAGALAPGEAADPSLLQFLCHHGGLPYVLAPPPYVIAEALAKEYYLYSTWCHERRALRDSLEYLTVPFEPGTKYCYSEVFLTLMSCLLEEVDGVSFVQLFAQEFPPQLGVMLRTDVFGYMTANHGWFADLDTVARTFEWLMGQPEFAIITEAPYARKPYIRVGCNIETDVRRGPVGREWWWGGAARDEHGNYFLSVLMYPQVRRATVRLSRKDYLIAPPPPIPPGYVAEPVVNPGFARFAAWTQRMQVTPLPAELLTRFVGRYEPIDRQTRAQEGDVLELTADGHWMLNGDGNRYPVVLLDGRLCLLSPLSQGPSSKSSSFVWYELPTAASGESDSSVSRQPIILWEDYLLRRKH